MWSSHVTINKNRIAFLIGDWFNWQNKSMSFVPGSNYGYWSSEIFWMVRQWCSFIMGFSKQRLCGLFLSIGGFNWTREAFKSGREDRRNARSVVLVVRIAPAHAVCHIATERAGILLADRMCALRWKQNDNRASTKPTQAPKQFQIYEGRVTE